MYTEAHVVDVTNDVLGGKHGRGEKKDPTSEQKRLERSHSLKTRVGGWWCLHVISHTIYSCNVSSKEKGLDIAHETVKHLFYLLQLSAFQIY